MGKGLPGAKFTIMRTVGMIMNLFGLIFTLVFGLMKFESALLMIGPLVGTILFVAFIKLETDAIDAHRPKLLLLAVILGFGLTALLNLAAAIDWTRIAQYYLTYVASIFALCMCWHYTLSIYKNEKTRFKIGYVIYLVLFGIVDFTFVTAIGLIATILVTIAFVMTLVAERQLISKKLMNYI